jgi:glucose/arabinose dehydrogenase
MSHGPKLTSACVACLLLLASCSGGDQDAGDRRTLPTTPAPTTPTSSPTPDDEPTGGGGRFRPNAVRVDTQVVASGFDAPLQVTHAGDSSGRLFVVEQDGLIWVLRGREVLEPPWLDISEKTEGTGEQGLLGLAFHPEFENNGRFFINYTDNAGNTVVAEYRATPGADRADGASERVLLTIDQPFPNHNGGGLAFGPDDYLYIGTGDGGSGGDPMGNGQSLSTLLGKLVRIDVDSRTRDLPYGIPSDNPFVNRDGRDEIWAYGLRNPWRFSFDGDTLWIGDVGQSAMEEIDRAPAGRAGVNYGWNLVEGTSCYEIDPCNEEGLWPPVATYGHSQGCSVTGGHVYRGRMHPELTGGYFFSDYCSGLIWAMPSRGRGGAVVVADTGRFVSSFGEDEAGEIYLTDLNSGDILRLRTR